MAVRKASLRIKKFDAKIDHDVIRDRFLKLKPLMLEQESEVFSDLERFENETKELLESKGVPVYQIPYYLCYMRELYKKVARSFTSETLKNEELSIRTKWVNRGLNDETLKDIARLFGIEPKPLPVGAPEYSGFGYELIDTPL